MRNIIIVGGELFNKGAQAMMFIAVNEIKKRFPKHEILVLSPMDLQRPKEETINYNFKFIGWYPTKFAKCQNNKIKRLIYKLRNGQELAECEKIYKNCDLLIDISGYALGSNWGVSCCNVYLEHLEFAKEFKIPFYLMPQSFGPFDFQTVEEKEIDKRIKELLPKAKLICAREEAGYLQLKKQYGLENVQIKTDIVLNNRGIDLKNIFKSIPQWDIPNIEGNSVAIIPNSNTIVDEDRNQLISLYKYIINELISLGKKVYLLSHATSDRMLCAEIKQEYVSNEQVIWLEQDFNCIEFNEVVKKFQFVIASRFHAIVHAYKNCIPCISIGWAIKYEELLREFNQEEYAFDVHHKIEKECILKAICNMEKRKEIEVKKIEEHLKILQKENVFDVLTF